MEGPRLLDDLLQAGVACLGRLVYFLETTTKHYHSQRLRHNNLKYFPAVEYVQLVVPSYFSAAQWTLPR